MRHKPRTLAALLLAIAWSPTAIGAAEIQLGQSGGIYTVPVQVNQSVTMEFLVDPGSAVVVIPRSALNRLVQNGTVSQNDVVGVSIAELADSSRYEAIRLKLRELRVGSIVAHDVIAAVAPGLTLPLLGQSFLGRFASVTFDNQRRVLILSESLTAAAPQYQYPTSQYPYPTTQGQAPYYPPAAAAPSGGYGYGYGQPGYWPYPR